VLARQLLPIAQVPVVLLRIGCWNVFNRHAGLPRKFFSSWQA